MIFKALPPVRSHYRINIMSQAVVRAPLVVCEIVKKIIKEIIRLPLPTFIYFRTKILVWIMFCLQCLDSISHFLTKTLFGLCFHLLFPTLSVNKMQVNCCKKSTGSCCSRSDATSSKSFRDFKRVSEEIILSAFQSFYVPNVQM